MIHIPSRFLFVMFRRLREGSRSLINSIIVMKTIDLCEEWLRSEGIVPSQLGDEMLLFKYVRYNILVAAPNEDQGYLKFEVTFGADNFSHMTRSELLEVASRISRERKAVKAYLEEDGDVVLSAEVLLDTDPKVEDIMPRALDMLVAASYKYIVGL